MDENKSNNLNVEQLSIKERFKKFLNTEVVPVKAFYEILGDLCQCDLPGPKASNFIERRRRRRKKNEENNQ